MSRAVHFEIHASDPQALIGFYGELFGWTFNKWDGGEYWVVHTGPDDKPGINGGLLPRRHVLVHDADAAVLREGDGQPGFRDVIHRRGKQRDVQPDGPGQLCCEADFSGQDGGVGGNEQDVVERERLLDDAHGNPRRKTKLYRSGLPRTTERGLARGLH